MEAIDALMSAPSAVRAVIPTVCTGGSTALTEQCSSIQCSSTDAGTAAAAAAAGSAGGGCAGATAAAAVEEESSSDDEDED